MLQHGMCQRLSYFAAVVAHHGFHCAAYRKSALEHHPDKAGAASADEATKQAIEEKFKAIQEAYETLSDPARRREFDSTDDFDDTLPMDCAPEDFIKVPNDPASLPALCLFRVWRVLIVPLLL